MPYYELGGVYKNSRGFSKILVFSSWKMVPRMIGTMLSYEAERKTIGKFHEKKEGEKGEGENAGYFAESRYPGQRLRFLKDGKTGKPRGMSLFTLLYPSEFLSGLYDPIKSLNNHKTEPSTQIPLTQLEDEIRSNLSESPQYLALKEYEDSTNPGTDQRDQRWYYLAPMLLDATLPNGIGDTEKWLKMQKGIQDHVDKLRENLKALEAGTMKLGKMPKDLLDTLVHMVLGSPAVCIYRSNGHNMRRATELARVFCNNFNLIESTAIVDLAYEGDSAYWKKVLKYCKDGCFQAMFDEYKHILGGSVGLCTEEAKKEEIIHKQMMESLTIRTATYRVDTFQSFCSRVKQKEPEKETQQESKSDMFLRAHYAKGLIQDAGDDEGKVKSQENVRNAFNSPMRPFVLASTSIGQEGLDFHNYCRRIMHWNLPSNPVDLEQREGRVNRYKCHAIRQNVAQEYGNIHFESDIWSEMFEAAKAERQEGQSELVPFWCFGKNQRVKIERIVPMYPMSKDEMNYERLIKKLSLYRLTMGQPRQEELLEYLFREFSDESALEKLKDLFINLSPFSKGTEGTTPSLQ
jgi:hypothetical protein